MKQSRIFLLVMAICLGAVSPINAQLLEQDSDNQETPTDPEIYTHGLYFAFSLPGAWIARDLAFREMNDYLDDRGIEFDPTNQFRSIVFGGYWKKTFFEGIIQTSQIGSIDLISEGLSDPSNAQEVTRNYQGLSFCLGRSFYQNRNVQLIGWAGAGIAGTTVEVHQLRGLNEIDMTQFPFSGERTGWPILYHRSSYVDLGVEYRIGRPKKKISISESIRIGYRHGFREQPWQAVGASVINGPTDRASQLYMRIDLILGYNVADKTR